MHLYRALIFLSVSLLFRTGAIAQRLPDRQSQWADSISQAEASKVRQQFILSDQQQEALHQANLQVYTTRQDVYHRYFKTDSFPMMIARVGRLHDSLYFSILGQRQFQSYRDTLFRHHVQILHKDGVTPKNSQ